VTIRVLLMVFAHGPPLTPPAEGIRSYRGDGGGDRGSSKCPMHGTALITLVTKLTMYTNNLLIG
jgi:hypothetical protein